jgi:hypothetical protein
MDPLDNTLRVFPERHHTSRYNVHAGISKAQPCLQSTVYYMSIHKIKRFRNNVCTLPNDKIIVEKGGPYDDTPHTISTLRHSPLGCTRAEAEWAVALNRVLAGELTWVNRCCYGT